MTEGWLSYSSHHTMRDCLDARDAMLKANPKSRIVCTPADSPGPTPQAEVRGTPA